MPALPPEIQTLIGLKVVYPPNPPLIKGGLYVLEETTASGSLQKEEKLKQVVGCVCVCVCGKHFKACVS